MTTAEWIDAGLELAALAVSWPVIVLVLAVTTRRHVATLASWLREQMEQREAKLTKDGVELGPRLPMVSLLPPAPADVPAENRPAAEDAQRKIRDLEGAIADLIPRDAWIDRLAFVAYRQAEEIAGTPANQAATLSVLQEGDSAPRLFSLPQLGDKALALVRIAQAGGGNSTGFPQDYPAWVEAARRLANRGVVTSVPPFSEFAFQTLGEMNRAVDVRPGLP